MQRGKQGGQTEAAASATLAQLGWHDTGRRLLTLRLTEPQWQTVQQAMLEAGGEPGAPAATEELLVACLRRWLAARRRRPDADRNPAKPHGSDARAFQPSAEATAADALAQLDAWLASLPAGTLFTVTLRRPPRYAGRGSAAGESSLPGAPLPRFPADRDEQHQQVSASGARRLLLRHGSRVGRIEAEKIDADTWTEAIDNWGTCE